MKLAEYVIDYYASIGIKDIFLVYGAANGDLVDAFVGRKDIRYVAVMHEQGGGFGAEGYAKTTGGLAVAMATSGPGGMNFVTPIGNCFYDSVPCVFITGQIKQRYMRPDPSIRQIGFQETDIVSIVKPITKYAKMISNPKNIKYELEKSTYLAMSGRPGPVLLDIPIDVQQAEINPDELIGYTFDAEPVPPGVTEDVIAQLIDDIYKSERPCLMIGGGVKGAARTILLDLIDRLGIPVFPTWNALDIVCSDNPYYGGRIGTYGGAGRNFGIQNCDLLIAIGTRISGRITGGEPSTFARGAKKYVVDIDAAMLQRNLQELPFDVCIHSTSYDFIDRFLEATHDQMPDFSEWMDKVTDWRYKYDPVTSDMYKVTDIVHPYPFCRMLSEECGENDIIVVDCGGNVVTMNHAFETREGQTYFTNNGNSPMGFAFAGAMGAAVAVQSHKMEGNVICVIGDGGMTMNIQELQTLVNYSLNVKVFILNNQIYGITKAYQETNFGGRAEACGPKGYSPPNFMDVANAYGVGSVKIDSLSRSAIRGVLDCSKTLICDVDCKEYHTYEPRVIGWETPIEDMYPYLPQEELEANMSIPTIKYKRLTIGDP